MTSAPLQFPSTPADSGRVGAFDGFCLYLWRSVEAPGAVYLAESALSAQTVCQELLQDGYIVKVVHMATGVEYEMQDGALLPGPALTGLTGGRSARHQSHLDEHPIQHQRL
jgi:hypothetical protein